MTDPGNTVMRTVEVVAAVIIKDNKVFATQRGYGDYKDWWEFPGGKTEPGETPEEALKREIREELDAEIRVGELLAVVEYDYPKFHLSMKCFRCELLSRDVVLIEHEAAGWLDSEPLKSVKWLPSDIEVVDMLAEKPRTER